MRLCHGHCALLARGAGPAQQVSDREPRHLLIAELGTRGAQDLILCAQAFVDAVRDGVDLFAGKPPAQILGNGAVLIHQHRCQLRNHHLVRARESRA